MSGTHSLDYRIITSPDEFLGLAEPWDRIATFAETIFATHAWLTTWLEIYGERAELHVLTAWHGDELVAALPLVRTADGGTRRLAYMGTGPLTPNHLDILVRPEHRDEALAGFARALIGERDGWDVIDLDKLPAPSGTADVLASEFGRAGLATSVGVSAVCPTIELPGSWDELAAGMSTSARRNIRFKLNRFQRECEGVSFRAATTEIDVAADLDALERFHQARWRGKGHTGSFADERFGRFQHAFAPEAHRRGQLRMRALEAEGGICAVLYTFRVGASIQYYMTGFDQTQARHSPGMLLLARAIEDSIEEGGRFFDFLEGEEAYKGDWPSVVKREDVRLLVFNATARGRLARAAEKLNDAVVATARRVVPESARLAVRQWSERRRAR